MMNRGYTREWYLERINAIRNIIPDCGISTDIISGFCSETEEDHQQTLSLMEEVQFDFAYMFMYSERPKTLAERKYKDDVSGEDKNKRHNQIMELQHKNSAIGVAKGLNKIHKELIDGVSKKSEEMFKGRNSQNAMLVFPKENYKLGDYVNVLVTSCTTTTMIGHVVKEPTLSK
jgi:tRNA-2-methylthio-N6-dimethylallyladenosine synthase